MNLNEEIAALKARVAADPPIGMLLIRYWTRLAELQEQRADLAERRFNLLSESIGHKIAVCGDPECVVCQMHRDAMKELEEAQ